LHFLSLMEVQNSGMDSERENMLLLPVAKEALKDKTNDALRTERETLKESSAQLESDLRKELEEGPVKSAAEIAELRKSVEELQHQNQSKKTAPQLASELRTELEGEQTNSAAEITELRKSLEKLQRQNKILEDEKTEFNGERETLLAASTDVEYELRVELEQEREKNKKAQSEAESLETKTDEKAALRSIYFENRLRQAKDAAKELDSYLREELQEEVEKLKTRAEEAEKKVETLQYAVDKSKAILKELEQLREEKRKVEVENKLFAQINARQIMTMLESPDETVDSDVVNSEKLIRLEIKRSQERTSQVTAQTYRAKLALEKTDGSSSSLELLNNPDDCDTQASLLRSVMRKKQPRFLWGRFGGLLGESMSEIGISAEEEGMHILEESELEQGISGNERSAKSKSNNRNK
jgi:chromosome segregation ATPase